MVSICGARSFNHLVRPQQRRRGIVSPSALAVLRLMVNTNRVTAVVPDVRGTGAVNGGARFRGPMRHRRGGGLILRTPLLSPANTRTRAGIYRRARSSASGVALLNHLVSTQQQRWRDCEPESFRRFDPDDQSGLWVAH